MTRPGALSSTAASAAGVVLILILGAGSPAHAVAPPPGAAVPGVEPGSVAPLVDRVKGAVVTIQSTKFIRRFAVEDPWSRMLREQMGLPGPKATREKQEALGSGFVVDRSGIILTNNHVVAGADEVIVKLADNRKFSARVLGSDPPTDVAVIRLDKPPADLAAVTLGDSDHVRVGDYVLAIGNPLGLGQTVTMGIVSAKNRVVGDKLGDVDPRYEDFIQTDAAINQGNSGGPLFNFRGEVIGINSAIINPSVAMNVGFAIPINLARQVADQIRHSGKVARGYLGVSTEDFTAERAAEMHVPFVAGALVNAVGRGSPAAAAGLASNDIITELAGKPVDGYRRLSAVVGLLRPGEKAKVVYQRNGQRAEATVTLSGPGQAGGGSTALLGMELRPLEAREATALGLPAGGGLAVISVDPRGPASGAIEEGDILLGLDGRPITLGKLKALPGRLQRGEHMTLIIQRGPDRFALQL
jgi:serine protease Do